ncbi:UNVERIFIED_CONTAM: hypothetical protein Sradi_5113900 [Sesamum radiatum]|uniref:Retrotransposon gag domain-containing protein n=1 Tax=Sesamum radiatum TaxID=300843 RepID=A0AAW2M4N5_SESRA
MVVRSRLDAHASNTRRAGRQDVARVGSSCARRHQQTAAGTLTTLYRCAQCPADARMTRQMRTGLDGRLRCCARHSPHIDALGDGQSQTGLADDGGYTRAVTRDPARRSESVEKVVGREEDRVPASKVKVSDPKPFGGVRSAKELENFLWDTEIYFQAARIPKAKKISITSMYLIGDAKLWWRTRLSNDAVRIVE